MVRRKTMKYRRKTMKRGAKRSGPKRSMSMSRVKRSMSMSRVKRSRRKNKNTKRKMRGGETVKEMVAKYEIIINENLENSEEISKENSEENSEEKILKACLTACKALHPFIQSVYEVLNYDNLKNKSIITHKFTQFINEQKKNATTELSKQKLNEKDIFTIADGMVQYIIRKYLFNNPRHFVGEETIEVTRKDKDDNQIEDEDEDEEIQVDQYILKQGSEETVIPKVFTNDINYAITKINNIKLDPTLFENYTIFVDPIDGTAEYQGTDKRSAKEKSETNFIPKGEQATIMIGFADIKTKKAVGGIIFRPVKNEDKPEQAGTYAYGWVIDETASTNNVYKSRLNMNTHEKTDQTIRFITSNGGISDPTKKLITKIEGERIGSGGAGNKILMLLEDKADVYLQDRGLSRWDTCAGEAILRCKDGLLCKLTEFEKTGTTDSRYTYTTTDNISGEENPNNNVDKNTAAKYIEQNSFIPADLVKEFKKIKGNEEELTNFIETHNIHHTATNNLCGLVAITGEKRYFLKDIYAEIQKLPVNKSTGLRFDYD